MDLPLRFESFLRPMPWGGRNLETRLGKRLPTTENYGESWEVSDHPLHRSIAATGPHAGQSLQSLMATERTALLGKRAKDHKCFPWLVKFLDASDWLSVQVHPDEQAVRHLCQGEGSKTEAWLILDAHLESRIYAGLQPGVNENKLRQAIKDGTVLNCLHSFQPQPGDFIFLPAGTVHAVGGGVLFAEIQETSDATFRLFDWNRRDAEGRPRKLHVDEAIASIHWDSGPLKSVHCLGFPGSSEAPPKAGLYRQQLTSCPYFGLEYIRATEAFECAGENRLELLVVLDGRGSLASSEVQKGQTWVLPASMPKSWCEPATTMHIWRAAIP
jgi:mannose-6-phosphate isomerase